MDSGEQFSEENVGWIPDDGNYLSKNMRYEYSSFHCNSVKIQFIK